ncbi:tetratricopeptide repeat protein [Flammeovirga aprica]|uniref:Tetratricopeptide repeat protein n=1 Tax=Flammeovirga aprica JL-4 TaxID=694437 RepID=A0A7X9XDA9_9BACT|nr:hypothetical protein [Flammeovirga aprica]NME72598.1 hypothetical protein [Flammeovirga aprica JL-4]
MARTLFKIFILFVCFVTSTTLFAQTDKALDHFVKAENLFNSKQFTKAIDEYTLAIKYDSTQEKYFLRKAKCQVALKQFNNAIDTFLEGLSVFPDNGVMNFQIANLYLRKDYLDDAIYYFDKSFQLNDTEKIKVVSKNQIIMILFKQEKYDKVRPHINDVLAVAPNNYLALYYSAKLYNMNKEYPKAVDDIHKALEYVKSSNKSHLARFYYELGYAYYNLEEYDKLEGIIDKANYGSYRKLVLKFTPEYKYWVALCYYEIYDFEKSTDLLYTALKQDQSNLKVHELQIKIAEVTSDKTEQIQKAYHMIDNLDDEQMKVKTYQDVATWQLGSEHYLDAIKSCDETLALDEYNYIVKYTKAVALFKLNRTKESMDVLNELVKYNGLDVKTKSKYYFTLGIVAMKEKEYDLALHSFKSAKLDKTYKVAADEIISYLKSKEDSI